MELPPAVGGGGDRWWEADQFVACAVADLFALFTTETVCSKGLQSIFWILLAVGGWWRGGGRVSDELFPHFIFFWLC